MKLIDADTIVHYQTYDDEHEEFPKHESTIADFLDGMTDEGCPKPVDAVPVVHGRWKAVTEDMVTYKRICSCCGKEAPYDMRDEDPLSEGYYMLHPYCPWCGAKMDGKDGDHHES